MSRSRPPGVVVLGGGIQGTCVTLVLGPFGDVVCHQDGRVYAWWYLECLSGWSDDLEAPQEWLQAVRGEDPPVGADR